MSGIRVRDFSALARHAFTSPLSPCPTVCRFQRYSVSPLASANRYQARQFPRTLLLTMPLSRFRLIEVLKCILTPYVILRRNRDRAQEPNVLSNWATSHPSYYAADSSRQRIYQRISISRIYHPPFSHKGMCQ